MSIWISISKKAEKRLGINFLFARYAVEWLEERGEKSAASLMQRAERERVLIKELFDLD
jgi:hypothetical protein